MRVLRAVAMLGGRRALAFLCCLVSSTVAMEAVCLAGGKTWAQFNLPPFITIPVSVECVKSQTLQEMVDNCYTEKVPRLAPLIKHEDPPTGLFNTCDKVTRGTVVGYVAGSSLGAFPIFSDKAGYNELTLNRPLCSFDPSSYRWAPDPIKHPDAGRIIRVKAMHGACGKEGLPRNYRFRYMVALFNDDAMTEKDGEPKINVAHEMAGSDIGAIDITLVCPTEDQPASMVQPVVASCPPLEIATSSLPPAKGGVRYSYNLNSLKHNGQAPVSLKIVSGSLPEGLSFNEGTGLISGTPPYEPVGFQITPGASQPAPFVVRLTDSCPQGPRSLDKPFTIPVTQERAVLNPKPDLAVGDVKVKEGCGVVATFLNRGTGDIAATVRQQVAVNGKVVFDGPLTLDIKQGLAETRTLVERSTFQGMAEVKVSVDVDQALADANRSNNVLAKKLTCRGNAGLRPSVTTPLSPQGNPAPPPSPLPTGPKPPRTFKPVQAN